VIDVKKVVLLSFLLLLLAVPTVSALKGGIPNSPNGRGRPQREVPVIVEECNYTTVVNCTIVVDYTVVNVTVVSPTDTKPTIDVANITAQLNEILNLTQQISEEIETMQNLVSMATVTSFATLVVVVVCCWQLLREKKSA